MKNGKTALLLFLALSMLTGCASQSWVLDQIDLHEQNSTHPPPIGSIIALAGGDTTNIPNGWLLCNGESVLISSYPDLFAAIDTSWGTGNIPAQTFNLPDLRGRFLRGVAYETWTVRDTDANIRSQSNSVTGGNSGNKIGSMQEDQLLSHIHMDLGHKHDVNNIIKHQGGSDRGGFPSQWINQFVRIETETGYAILSTPVDSIGLVLRQGNESRPKNAYVNWIIKAKR